MYVDLMVECSANLSVLLMAQKLHTTEYRAHTVWGTIEADLTTATIKIFVILYI